MATINYGQLANDGFSLLEGDIIPVHGTKYQVRKSDISGKYYLANTTGYNDEIFYKLHNVESKYSLARIYEKDVDDKGCFPEFNNLNNLTKFAALLIKTPLFKVGDKVKISKFKTGENYPFGFNDGMQKHSGEVATISYVGDGLRNHHYNLKGIAFSWSENQLELVSEAKTAICPSEKHIESLKVDETVIVGGKECVVRGDKARDAYWISLEDELEQVIYDNLGITNEQKVSLAEKYHATELVTFSPEFGSLEDLTDFVNALNSGEWKNIVRQDKEEKPKKDITYEDLIDGYVLKDDDTLTLAGDKYKVCAGEFLVSNEVKWDAIFDKVGIEDKDGFCEKFGELRNRNCIFPEFKTAEGLTKCVIELMERADHTPVSPEPFAVSMDYVQFSESTIDSGPIRLPVEPGDCKIIIL